MLTWRLNYGDINYGILYKRYTTYSLLAMTEHTLSCVQSV